MCNMLIQREFSGFPLLASVSAMHHERGITGTRKESQIPERTKMTNDEKGVLEVVGFRVKRVFLHRAGNSHNTKDICANDKWRVYCSDPLSLIQGENIVQGNCPDFPLKTLECI